MKKILKQLAVSALLVATFGSTVCFAGDYDFVAPVSSPVFDWTNKSPNGNIMNTNNTATNAKNSGMITDGTEKYYYVGDVTNGTGVSLALPGTAGSYAYDLTDGKMLGVSVDFMLKKTADIESAIVKPYIIVMSRFRPQFNFTHIANSDTFSLDVNGTKHNSVPLSYSKWYTLKFVLNTAVGGFRYELSEQGVETSLVSGTKTGLTDNGGNMNSVRFIRKNEAGTSTLASDTAAAKCAEMYIDNYQVTRENFVVGTPTVTAEAAAATASVVVKNESRSEKTTPLLILGVYDENGALIGVDAKSDTVSAREASNNAAMPEKTLNCSVAVTGDKVIETARAFVWNSWSGMVPHISTVEQSVEADN